MSRGRGSGREDRPRGRQRSGTVLSVGSPIRPRLRVHARPVLIARPHVARRAVGGMRRAISVGRARGRDGRICGGVNLACSYRASASPHLSRGQVKTNYLPATYPRRARYRSLDGVDTDVECVRGMILTERKQDTHRTQKWASPTQSRRSA